MHAPKYRNGRGRGRTVGGEHVTLSVRLDVVQTQKQPSSSGAMILRSFKPQDADALLSCSMRRFGHIGIHDYSREQAMGSSPPDRRNIEAEPKSD
jgi:hypothetical protein